jgi:peroxiredoxin
MARITSKHSTPPLSRPFHCTTRALINVGDTLPDLDVLVERSPGNKVNLAREFDGQDGVVIGVPGAFSGACSQTHVPSYMKHPKIRDAGKVFVVAGNDAFVTKAWSESLDPAGQTGVRSCPRDELTFALWALFTGLMYGCLCQFRFLGDPTLQFTKALELDFDATPVFGGIRSKRYALIIENGKVSNVLRRRWLR